MVPLRSVAADPARKISSLMILDDSERYELVVENNRTSAIYPRHLTLPQLFEAQAGRTPEAVAVVCGERSMNYRELDIASNRLAYELRRHGVEPASRVAVILDRSPELMVALLAVLKAGSAYIPLDPAYPAERLQYIFESSRPAVIITQASLRERLVHEAMSVIVLDSQSMLIAKQSTEPHGGAGFISSVDRRRQAGFGEGTGNGRRRRVCYGFCSGTMQVSCRPRR